MAPVDYLERILKNKKKEVEDLIQETNHLPKHPLNEILSQEHIPKFHFSSALKRTPFSVIGEVKRRSPTCGEIGTVEDPALWALQYCQGGAAAISVLTEREDFGGSLSDMRHVVDAVLEPYPSVAVLRKDFILHPLQLAEAVFAGAHAVLLIVRVVREDLRFLIHEAERLGLEVVTEVHNHAELECALAAGASIIAINHRNLNTFEIDLELSERLRPCIPASLLTIAASGIHQPKEAQRLRALGLDAILVGEALVRAKDPARLLQHMQGGDDES